MKHIFALIFLIMLITIGLHLYLQPNDLASCKDSPVSYADIETESKCLPADAVVAISGGDTNARADKAISLFKNGWASKIVFSGAAADTSGPSNAKVMRDRAINAGIPSGDILIDEYSRNTTENAKNSSEIFRDNNIEKVILVTSGYHQRRASLEFNQKSPNVMVLNAPVLSDKNWGFFWWLNPYNWWLASSEAIKILAFYITGGNS